MTMWSELEALDRDEPIWRIPAARMKLDRNLDARFDFMLPLFSQPSEVLDTARARASQPPYVPCQRRCHGPISEHAVGLCPNAKSSFLLMPQGTSSVSAALMSSSAVAHELAMMLKRSRCFASRTPSAPIVTENRPRSWQRRSAPRRRRRLVTPIVSLE